MSKKIKENIFSALRHVTTPEIVEVCQALQAAMIL
jgi:hypothetical protein